MEDVGFEDDVVRTVDAAGDGEGIFSVDHGVGGDARGGGGRGMGDRCEAETKIIVGSFAGVAREAELGGRFGKFIEMPKRAGEHQWRDGGSGLLGACKEVGGPGKLLDCKIILAESEEGRGILRVVREGGAGGLSGELKGREASRGIEIKDRAVELRFVVEAATVGEEAGAEGDDKLKPGVNVPTVSPVVEAFREEIVSIGGEFELIDASGVSVKAAIGLGVAGVPECQFTVLAAGGNDRAVGRESGGAARSRTGPDSTHDFAGKGIDDKGGSGGGFVSVDHVPSAIGEVWPAVVVLPVHVEGCACGAGLEVVNRNIADGGCNDGGGIGIGDAEDPGIIRTMVWKNERAGSNRVETRAQETGIPAVRGCGYRGKTRDRCCSFPRPSGRH